MNVVVFWNVTSFLERISLNWNPWTNLTLVFFTNIIAFVWFMESIQNLFFDVKKIALDDNLFVNVFSRLILVFINSFILDLQNRGIGFYASVVLPVSSEISYLSLFFSYFASQNKEIKSDNYFFDVCCVN